MNFYDMVYGVYISNLIIIGTFVNIMEYLIVKNFMNTNQNQLQKQK